MKGICTVFKFHGRALGVTGMKLSLHLYAELLTADCWRVFFCLPHYLMWLLKMWSYVAFHILWYSGLWNFSFIPLSVFLYWLIVLSVYLCKLYNTVVGCKTIDHDELIDKLNNIESVSHTLYRVFMSLVFYLSCCTAIRSLVQLYIVFLTII